MKRNSAKTNKVIAAGLSLKFEIEEDNARSFVNNKVKIEIKQEIEEQTNLSPEDNFFAVKSEVDENSEDVFCSSCKKVFSTSKLLEEHITTDPECKLNKNLKNNKTEREFVTLNSEELAITFFNASNNTVSSMKLELKENLYGFSRHETHLLQNGSTPEKSNFCECCSKSFSSNTEFDNHKEIHLKEEHQLNSLKITRTGKKSHACDTCNKEFSCTSSLKIHNLSHTGEKPYVCDSCNKGFSKAFSLKVHRRSHTGEKPYVCDICERRFIRFDYLRDHKRTHTGEKPFACDCCNKRFSYASSLKVHKRLHTGEKPYVCDSCNKGFSQAISLKLHKRTHTGEKPYACNICDKRFAHSGNLTKHKRTHVLYNHTAFHREP